MRGLQHGANRKKRVVPEKTIRVPGKFAYLKTIFGEFAMNARRSVAPACLTGGRP